MNGRGAAALGGKWEEYAAETFTEEENAAAQLEAEIMLAVTAARREKCLSQRRLAELTNLKQPQIARLELGQVTPRIDTVQKLLYPLGLKLAIVPR